MERNLKLYDFSIETGFLLNGKLTGNQVFPSITGFIPYSSLPLYKTS